MVLGSIIFVALALLCIVAGAVAMKRSRDYGKSDGADDDFDFDAYEGFDK